MLESVVEITKKHGGYSYKGGRCGIHIHRSIGPFRMKANRVKLLRSLIAIEPFAYIVAQRTGVAVLGTDLLDVPRREYGSFVQIKRAVGEHGIGSDDPEAWERAAINYCDEIGYEVEGMEFNRHGLNTVEIRIFRGTLNVDTIMAYLGFYHFLCEWALSVDISKLLRWNHTTSWKNFAGFIKNHETEFSSHVLKYIESRGVIV